ncbi:unnamed protein product [Euphydryas editha]|uniref:G-protein coupled receptors family 1 profile domain-containing protein n=1 Tax=Euphydryas editha TaxID=104508 RepID=A0AAU9TX61_EUPED|nr:unnamed protein product [Euphydryas editha]
MDVTCSTSSIFNLVAISVDRYIAVTQPIKYAKHKSNARVWVMIAVAWLVSGAIGSPVVLGLNNTPDRSPDQCLFNSTDYVIYSSLGSFYIPCIIMMFLYYKIFKAIRQRAKKQRVAKTSSAISSAVSSGTAAVVIENFAQTQKFVDVPEDRPTNTASGSNEDDDDKMESNKVSCSYGYDIFHSRMNEFQHELENTKSPVWFAKTKLKGTGFTESEFLRKSRYNVFLEAKKRFGIGKCCTRDGCIYIIAPDGSRNRIVCSSELDTTLVCKSMAQNIQIPNHNDLQSSGSA